MTFSYSCTRLLILSTKRTIQLLQLRTTGHVVAPQWTEEEVLLFKMTWRTVPTTLLLCWMIDRVVSIDAAVAPHRESRHPVHGNLTTRVPFTREASATGRSNGPQPGRGQLYLTVPRSVSSRRPSQLRPYGLEHPSHAAAPATSEASS